MFATDSNNCRQRWSLPECSPISNSKLLITYLPANIGLGWNWLAVTNTLAYFDMCNIYGHSTQTIRLCLMLLTLIKSGPGSVTMFYEVIYGNSSITLMKILIYTCFWHKIPKNILLRFITLGLYYKNYGMVMYRFWSKLICLYITRGSDKH